MITLNIILYGLLIVACIAFLIIVFRSKGEVDYLQEEKNGKIINSSTRMIFFIGNFLMIWYVAYQVTHDKAVDIILVSGLAAFSNGVKIWKGYQETGLKNPFKKTDTE
jgi:hypothetical protein